ncbi:MAG: hypothetical protein QGD89_09030 [Actinomycetota bacterium]|nr:hypothetical protein [Actinomycetota bacterium]
MGRAGDALADRGNPFGPGSSLVDDGPSGTVVLLTGYSIVEADDMAGALAHVDGHPFLVKDTGNYAIDDYELLPVPGA